MRAPTGGCSTSARQLLAELAVGRGHSQLTPSVDEERSRCEFVRVPLPSNWCGGGIQTVLHHRLFLDVAQGPSTLLVRRSPILRAQACQSLRIRRRGPVLGRISVDRACRTLRCSDLVGRRIVAAAGFHIESWPFDAPLAVVQDSCERGYHQGPGTVHF